MRMIRCESAPLNTEIRTGTKLSASYKLVIQFISSACGYKCVYGHISGLVSVQLSRSSHCSTASCARWQQPSMCFLSGYLTGPDKAKGGQRLLPPAASIATGPDLTFQWSSSLSTTQRNNSAGDFKVGMAKLQIWKCEVCQRAAWHVYSTLTMKNKSNM